MKVSRLQVVGYSLLFFILSTVHCNLFPIQAYENDIGISRLDPSSPFYSLKVIREDIEFKFALTDRVKSLRQLEFATRRLREMKALMNKNEDLIPPTLEKYNHHLHNLDIKLIKEEEVLRRIRESLAVHSDTLTRSYNNLSTARAKMYVRSALNRISQRSDFPEYAKLAVCNLYVQEASSSALNEGEKEVLKSRIGQICI